MREGEQIQISLMRQDEQDRQQTQLYGLNEEFQNKRESKSVVKINENCVGCSGNGQYVKKAFKLACLAYKSSLVVHSGQRFSRSELFEKRASIVDGIEELVGKEHSELVKREIEV